MPAISGSKNVGRDPWELYGGRLGQGNAIIVNRCAKKDTMR